MARNEDRRTIDAPAPPSRRRLTRRRFLEGALGASGLLLVTACGGATAPTAKTDTKPADTKPAAEATKPAAAPAAASPAAGAAASSSPAAAASPSTAGASAAASPAAAQSAPAAKTGAPPNLKGTTLTVLHDSSFIPEADVLFKQQIEQSFMKDTGAVVNIEFVNQNDIAAKVSAAIQGGSGPDIVESGHGWGHVYKEGLADLTDVAKDVKKLTGDFFPQSEAYSKVEGKYLTVPRSFLGNAIHYRKSWFQEVGASTFPETYDEWHAVGAKLKANGHPLGQCLGHSVNDPNIWCYTMLWGYGGQEVDQTGKVTINSPETIAAVKAMADAWKPAYDETGLAWDDASNNRAFLAETNAATLNGASVYWVATKDKAPFLDDIGLALPLAGPKGRVTQGVAWSQGIMKYTRNLDAAKAFVRWTMTNEIWMPWFEVAQGFYNGVGPRQDDNPGWEKFSPALKLFKGFPANSRAIGWPGPADQRASLALAKYIVVDMFARAVQGESPESAVKWAEGEYRTIYG